MDDLGAIIQILFVVGVILAAIGKVFYNIFVKPFVPPRGAPGAPGAPPPGKNLKDFLDELRRDLGHGEGGEPRTAGLLDENEEEEEVSPAGGTLSRGPPASRPAPGRLLRHPERPVPVEPPLLPSPAPRPAPLRDWRSDSEREVDRLRERAHARAAQSPSAPPAGRPEPTTVQSRREITVQRIVEATETVRTEVVDQAVAYKGMGGARSIWKLLGTDLQTAIVLQEILGPPRAHRRYRPPRSR
jgi:hypothetical protein